jgi:transposase
MTGVETIARIRFEHFRNGKGIKRIARELGIARDTVRKVLRSGATEFVYKREVQPQRKLGAWIETLTAILEAEDKLPRRERRSTVRLFEELRGRGYDGAHDSVHRFVKSWRTERARAPMHAFVPLRFDPGEAYQFDWSHEAIELHGLPLTVKLAQMRLSYSRMPFVRAYFRETQEMVFDAHDRAFAFMAEFAGAGFTTTCERRWRPCSSAAPAPTTDAFSSFARIIWSNPSPARPRRAGRRARSRTRSARCATSCSGQSRR